MKVSGLSFVFFSHAELAVPTDLEQDKIPCHPSHSIHIIILSWNVTLSFIYVFSFHFWSLPLISLTIGALCLNHFIFLSAPTSSTTAVYLPATWLVFFALLFLACFHVCPSPNPIPFIYTLFSVLFIPFPVTVSHFHPFIPLMTPLLLGQHRPGVPPVCNT